MPIQLIVTAMVETLDGCVLDGVVHLLGLSVRPRMVDFSAPVLDAALVADPTGSFLNQTDVQPFKAMAARACHEAATEQRKTARITEVPTSVTPATMLSTSPIRTWFQLHRGSCIRFGRRTKIATIPNRTANP
jgi:hypothetical protein